MGIGSLIVGDDVVGLIVVVVVGTSIDDDLVVGVVDVSDEQLWLWLAAKQHAHTILAQSIRISILDTEHNADGIVPFNCVLLNNHKPVSRVSSPKDDGMVPFN